MRARLKKHFEGQSIHYTKAYPAQKLIYLCTAPTASGEAYLYHEMLRRMPPNQAWKLGGFVQTSSRPSNLDCLLAEEARRGMNELCFNCGANRFRGEHLKLRKCPFPLRGVEYKCPLADKPRTCQCGVEHRCSGKMLVTSRGHAEMVPETIPAATPPSLKPPAPKAPSKKRPAPPQPLEPVRKSARSRTAASSSSAGCEQVRICGRMYTALSWFLKNSNPSKKQCGHAIENCHTEAIELKGAHVRALSGTAYAKVPPSRPKPLCLVRSGSERERMGDEPVNTEVKGPTIARATGGLSKRLSQVLFPVHTLEKPFAAF